MHPKIKDKPHDNGCHKDRGSRFCEIVLHLLIYINPDGMRAGRFVFRQFDQQAVIGIFPVEHMNQKGCHNGHQQSQHIHGIGRNHGMILEKHLGKQHINRQPGAAGHEWRHHHGAEPVLSVLQRSGGHNGRHGTSEAQQHGDKCPSGQSQFSHNPVHHIGGAGHISAVLQDSQGQKQDENVGKEC